MGDITAVVLTIGEAYTQRALDSLARQTLPAAETVIVRDVVPFHRALNAGAARVRTPYFVQVDADVVLDACGLAELRARMDARLGLVSGFLRDPMLGRTQGVRLYRTACFARVQIRDSISPDLDFGRDIAAHGWGRLYALRYDLPPPQWHTLGDHLPDYTRSYTFAKFVLEGVRVRYRRHEGRVAESFRRLRHSPHAAADIAFIGAAHGLFLVEQRDLLRPYGRTPELARLDAFLAAGGVAADPGDLGAGSEEADFQRAAALGRAWREAGASHTFLRLLRRLKAQGGAAAWLAALGLCHGLFHPAADAARAYASVRALLEYGEPW